MNPPTPADRSAFARYLAEQRWAKPDADRDQPRRAGKLGGRPASTCECGTCRNCKSRARRQVKEQR